MKRVGCWVKGRVCRVSVPALCKSVEGERRNCADGWTASQAEFHEFNFGHDVVVESEKALRHLTESKQAV